MNRRITKTMAEVAASNMKNKAYGRKIEDAMAEVNAAVEKLVRKYIPAPIIACVNEFSTYFDYSTGACITTIVEKDGWTSASAYINGKLTFKIPNNSRYIKVDREEYDALRKLDNKRINLEKARDALGEQIRDALVVLKTENNIKKELPEAMKYIAFPEVKAVPMSIYAGLRDIIANIKDKESI